MIKSSNPQWKITKVNAPESIGVAVGLFHAKIEEKNPFSVNSQRQKRLYAQKESTPQARKNYYELLKQEKLAKRSLIEELGEVAKIKREMSEMKEEFGQALREKAESGQLGIADIKREKEEFEIELDKKRRSIKKQEYNIRRASNNLHRLKDLVKKMKEIL